MFSIAWLLATALAADPACPGAPDSSNDTDADGFVDACVDPSTSVGAGATIGAATTVAGGGSVGSGAVLGPNLTVGNGVTIGARAVLTGGATESVFGAGGAIGRRATLAGTFSLGPTAAIARATTLGDGLSAGHTFSVGYGAVAGADLDAGDRVTLGNLATLGASVTLGTGARVGRDALIQDGAWLGEDVSVGPGAQVASSVADPTLLHDDAVVRRGGRVAVGAELWDGATVGRDAEVRAGATIGVGAVVRSMAVVLAGAAVPDLAVIPRGNRYPPPSYDAPQPTWATPPPPPGTGRGELYAVAVHPNGDLVSGGLIFGTGIDGVTTLGTTDAYIRVTTGAGALVWGDTLDGPSADRLNDVAVLANGDVVGVGYTEGTLPGFTGSSSDSGIVGRWSASGERQFVDQATGLGVRRYESVCSDGAGGYYVGGYADGWYAQQNTGGDAVVVRYDAANNRQWVVRPRVSGGEYVHALAPRPGGGVYVLGATQSAPAGWTFLGGHNDAFIEALDENGARVGYAQLGTADYEYAYGLDVSDTGLIAISGHTGGSMPGYTDASPGSASAFVAVLDADLDVQWIIQLDTLAISTLPAVAWDAQGRLHAVGLVSESFPGHPHAGLRDQLHLVFDAGGTLLHSAQYGGPNNDEFEDVDIAADGDVVIAGDRIFNGSQSQGDLVRLPNID